MAPHIGLAEPLRYRAAAPLRFLFFCLDTLEPLSVTRMVGWLLNRVLATKQENGIINTPPHPHPPKLGGSHPPPPAAPPNFGGGDGGGGC